MEAIFILALIVLAAWIFYVRTNREEPPESPTKAKRQSTNQRITKTSQPASFDSGTAKHTPVSRRISGPARIVDGDTVVIRKTQILLFGIDAPEINHPYGHKAKWALVRMCKGHAIEAEILEEDAYGRTVAHCFLPDGRDLFAEMVRQGLAIDWPKFSNGAYRLLETPDARKKLWLADARQKGRMHVWEKFEARQSKPS